MARARKMPAGKGPVLKAVNPGNFTKPGGLPIEVGKHMVHADQGKGAMKADFTKKKGKPSAVAPA